MAQTPQQQIMELTTRELPQLRAVLKLNAQPGADVDTIALQEIEFFYAQALVKPEIYQCSGPSIITALRTVIKQNLSMDPYAGLVYIKTRNVETPTGWQKVLEIQPTANGLISIARQCGRILDVERPQIIKDDAGKVVGVIFRFQKPSFDKLGNPCTRWEEVEFDESDFYRWRRASHAENGRKKQDANRETLNYANPNYTNWKAGPDPEFIRAKAIRHGLKKLGVNPNESRVTKFSVALERSEQIVDPTADMKATGDDVNTSFDYIQHEEIKEPAKAQGPASAPVINPEELPFL